MTSDTKNNKPMLKLALKMSGIMNCSRLAHRQAITSITKKKEKISINGDRQTATGTSGDKRLSPATIMNGTRPQPIKTCIKNRKSNPGNIKWFTGKKWKWLQTPTAPQAAAITLMFIISQTINKLNRIRKSTCSLINWEIKNYTNCIKISIVLQTVIPVAVT